MSKFIINKDALFPLNDLQMLRDQRDDLLPPRYIAVLSHSQCSLFEDAMNWTVRADGYQGMWKSIAIFLAASSENIGDIQRNTLYTINELESMKIPDAMKTRITQLEQQ